MWPFKNNKKCKAKTSAEIAKERLLLSIQHQKASKDNIFTPEIITELQEVILSVLNKYHHFDSSQIIVKNSEHNGNNLEIDIDASK